MKYNSLLTKQVEEKMAHLLPKHFSLMFDGWTNGEKHSIFLVPASRILPRKYKQSTLWIALMKRSSLKVLRSISKFLNMYWRRFTGNHVTMFLSSLETIVLLIYRSLKNFIFHLLDVLTISLIELSTKFLSPVLKYWKN